jgi:hypothetical protein
MTRLNAKNLIDAWGCRPTPEEIKDDVSKDYQTYAISITLCIIDFEISYILENNHLGQTPSPKGYIPRNVY